MDAGLSHSLLLVRRPATSLQTKDKYGGIDSFGLSGVSLRPHTSARSATSPIFLISFKGKVMKEIKKIGLVARLSSVVRRLLGLRRVRVYVLRPELVFVPSPAQEQHLRWQRFLVHLELQRVQRWEQQRYARRVQRLEARWF